MKVLQNKCGNGLAFAILTIFVLVYAPMSFEYFFKYFNDNSPQLWNHFFKFFVGEKHALGYGSVDFSQHTAYVSSRVSMLIHTMGGGIVILISCLQFYRTFRLRHPKVHRVLGYIQVFLVTATMFGAISYLIKTGPTNTYNGLAFYLQLWLLAIGTLLSSYLAIFAIIKKQVLIHQTLMIFNFSLLLSAPVLRLEWLFIGQIPNITQETSNLFSALIYGYLAVPCAILISRHIDFRYKFLNPTVRSNSNLAKIIGKFSLLTSILIIALYYREQNGFDAFFIVTIVLSLLTYLIFNILRLKAKKIDNEIAWLEWEIHCLSFKVIPLIALPSWLLLSNLISSEVAFHAVSLTIPALCFALGYFTMIWSRRVFIIKNSE
ncbi:MULTISPECIES: DUF2306 domain-containing protein [Acinetobacter]|uniref:DUF2306 domain-containing protein n=1 Tax=Acinetobacter TaxID=469 RepID=UPI0018DFA98F|nr:DUF2306 domain-containing protein [Acinetobacter sp. ACIN00229]MBI0422349.1 DUF2306 domain-containing protein [Acinetobacter sp. ACIN00229]